MANHENEVLTTLRKSESSYLVECVFKQPVYDIIVVNDLSKKVFFIQVSQQHAAHSKPHGDYAKNIVEKFKNSNESTYSPFYVYATIRMQKYTTNGGRYIFL